MSPYQKPIIVPVQMLMVWGDPLRAPISVWLKLTHACNLNCVYCYGKSDKPSPNELSTQELKKIIDELVEIHVFGIHFFGGEPLLREDFFELLHYASKKGFKPSLTTNGTLVNYSVGKKLKAAGLRSATICIEGASPTSHDAIVGVPGAFKRSVNAIKTLKSLGIRVSMNFVMTKQTIREFPRVAELAEKLDVTVSPTWFAMCGFGGWSKESGLTAEWRKNTQPILVKAKERHESRVSLSAGPCGVGRTTCSITPEGYVIPCEYHPAIAGDVRKQSLQEIWLNSEILKQLRTASGLKGKCGKCEQKWICLGGCRARAYIYYGNLQAPDPTCIKGITLH